MRPTDSSLAAPGWLVGAVVALVLLTVTAALLPREVLLGRIRLSAADPQGNGADWRIGEESVHWDQTPLPYLFHQPLAGPCLIVVTAPDDAACQRMSRQVFRDRWCAEQLAEGFRCVRVPARGAEPGLEASGADSLVAAFGVKTLPTILVLNADRTVAARVEGYPGRDALMAELLPRGAFHTHGYGGD